MAKLWFIWGIDPINISNTIWFRAVLTSHHKKLSVLQRGVFERTADLCSRTRWSLLQQGPSCCACLGEGYIWSLWDPAGSDRTDGNSRSRPGSRPEPGYCRGSAAPRTSWSKGRVGAHQSSMTYRSLIDQIPITHRSIRYWSLINQPSIDKQSQITAHSLTV